MPWLRISYICKNNKQINKISTNILHNLIKDECYFEALPETAIRAKIPSVTGCIQKRRAIKMALNCTISPMSGTSSSTLLPDISKPTGNVDKQSRAHDG